MCAGQRVNTALREQDDSRLRWKDSSSGTETFRGVEMIQANNGLTMIRLAKSVERWGCTDFGAALTAVAGCATL